MTSVSKLASVASKISATADTLFPVDEIAAHWFGQIPAYPDRYASTHSPAAVRVSTRDAVSAGVGRTTGVWSRSSASGLLGAGQRLFVGCNESIVGSNRVLIDQSIPPGLNVDMQRRERIRDIFEQLLGTPQKQRPVLLDRLCGDDAELKIIVASMLESKDSGQRVDKGSVTTPVHVDPSWLAREPVDAAVAGARVGPWRLERKLGTGGMGVVWLAQRADGQF